MEAKRFTDSQGITRILGKPKVHYRFYKRPPPVPILSQLDPIHTLTPYFLNIHLNIIVPSIPVFQVVSFPQVSQPKPCIRFSLDKTKHGKLV